MPPLCTAPHGLSASLYLLQLHIPLLVALASAHLKDGVWDLLRSVQLLSSCHSERLALDWLPLALGPFWSKSLWWEDQGVKTRTPYAGVRMGELPLPGVMTTAGSVMPMLSTRPCRASGPPSADTLSDSTPLTFSLLSHLSQLQAPCPSTDSSPSTMPVSSSSPCE